MGKILVTGARGFIGTRLIESLADQHQIKAFLRPGSQLSKSIASHPNVKVVFGDIRDKGSLSEVIEENDSIFHLAAFAKPWAKDFSAFSDINIHGKENVVRAAIEKGASKVILTSSAGTFGPQVDSEPIDENIEQTTPLSTAYEKTKKEGVDRAFELAKGQILCCALSPTRVFGPGPISTSNAVTKLINQYIFGSYRYVPGDGKTIGNYVYVDDVIKAHELALRHGKDQSNYLIGGVNLSYRQLFDAVGEAIGNKKELVGIPLWLMLAISKVFQFNANTFGIEPPITPPFVRKYTYNWATDISKAKHELDYRPTDFKEALEKTIRWLSDQRKQK